MPSRPERGSESQNLKETLRAWTSKADREDALTLVLDFASDVREVLAAIARNLGRRRRKGRLRSVRWVDAKSILTRLSLDRRPATQEPISGELVALGVFPDLPLEEETLARAMVELSRLEHAFFIVDFSEIVPEMVFGGSQDDAKKELLSRVSSALSDFSSWATVNGHGVVIGLPRYLLGIPTIARFCAESSWAFMSGDLYDSRAEMASYSGQKLPTDTLLVEDALNSLQRSNSSTLQQTLEVLTSSLSADERKAYVRDDKGIRTLIRIAHELVQQRFYEIAYRLEVLCRTVKSQQEFISLDADIDFEPDTSRPRERVVGFIEGLHATPAVIRLGVLAGEPGSGKTTALLQMEHFWSVPQRGLYGVSHPAWAPVFVPLHATQAVDLTHQLQNAFEEHALLAIDARGNSERLACHSLLADIATASNLHWLFSSPIFLLLDGMDEISSVQRNELTRGLLAFEASPSRPGILLTFRKGELSLFTNQAYLEVRPMNDAQFRALVRKRRGSDTLVNLLEVSHGRPFVRCLFNPFLLTLICSMGLGDREVVKLNLKALLEQYVQNASQLKTYTRKQARQITDTILPKIALEMTRNDLSSSRFDDLMPPNLVARARAMGLLRHHAEDGVVQFAHGLLQDFFAANALAPQIATEASAAIREIIDGSAHSRLVWSDVLRICVPMLRGDQLDEFLSEVAERDVRLAHGCLLEASEDQRWGLRAAEAVPRTIVERIESNGDLSDDKIEDGKTLGFLDPRISVEDPVAALVNVAGDARSSGFRISKYPVTNIEFSRFVDADGYENEEFWDIEGTKAWVDAGKIRYPKYWLNDHFNKPNYPVVGVCFYEALAYCKWLSQINSGVTFTLATATEWDQAAHDADADFLEVFRGWVSAYSQSLAERYARERDDAGLDDAGRPTAEDLHEIRDQISKATAYMEGYEDGMTTSGLRPVGIGRPNGRGCFDMFGNVWEWCDAWLVADEDGPSVASNDTGLPVIVKGGPRTVAAGPIWLMLGGWFDPYTRTEELGFRICAKDETASNSDDTDGDV